MVRVAEKMPACGSRATQVLHLLQHGIRGYLSAHKRVLSIIQIEAWQRPNGRIKKVGSIWIVSAAAREALPVFKNWRERVWVRIVKFVAKMLPKGLL